MVVDGRWRPGGGPKAVVVWRCFQARGRASEGERWCSEERPEEREYGVDGGCRFDSSGRRWWRHDGGWAATGAGGVSWCSFWAEEGDELKREKKKNGGWAAVQGKSIDGSVRVKGEEESRGIYRVLNSLSSSRVSVKNK